jgi:hypothetical protein
LIKDFYGSIIKEFYELLFWNMMLSLILFCYSKYSRNTWFDRGIIIKLMYKFKSRVIRLEVKKRKYMLKVEKMKNDFALLMKNKKLGLVKENDH